MEPVNHQIQLRITIEGIKILNREQRPTALHWSYPDSVDRCQGFTGESVRVLMNCCS